MAAQNAQWDYPITTFWKQSARLCRRPEQAAQALLPAGRIASGSLEDMIRQAVTLAAGAGAEKQEALFIDCGRRGVLEWPEIRRLFQSPDFPVEI